MPGRPKTQRRREPTEVRKTTKMPKTGTIIRCSKCHLPGHNRSTCTNISATGTSQAGGSQSTGGSSHPKRISHLQDHTQQVLSQLQEVTQMLWLCCLIHKRAAQAVQKGSPHLMYLVHRLRKRYVYLHLKVVTYAACI
jgi:hypothetical protein